MIGASTLPNMPMQSHSNLIVRPHNLGIICMLYRSFANRVRKDRHTTTTSTAARESKSTKSKIFSTDSGLYYEKILDADIRLGRTILAAKAGKSLGNENTILLEGTRLIRDALLLGAEGINLYFTDPAILSKLPTTKLKDVNLFKILYRDMKTWSDTTTPSGLLGVFKKPEPGQMAIERDTTLPITVVLDRLRDPGNAGTIIRTAAAVGCQRLITTPGTVNIWSGKVLRSSMGGHFSVPLHSGVPWSDLDTYLTNSNILLADTCAGRTLHRAFDSNINLDDLDMPDSDDNTSSDSDDSDSDEDAKEQIKIDQILKKDSQKENLLYKFHKVPMPVCEYSDLVISSPDKPSDRAGVTLVLGGETHGISAQAKKFAFDRYGQYVTIPMCQTVDSLNTGIAASIILYELRKKLLKQRTNVNVTSAHQKIINANT